MALSHSEPVTEQPSTKRPRKKRSLLRRLFTILLLIVLLPVLTLLGLGGWALASGTSAAAYTQEDALIQVRIENLGKTLVNAMRLRALDSALEDPAQAELRQSLRLLRATPALGSWWFKLISDIPLDASLYPGNEWAACVDLGLRAALVPPALLALRIRPDLIGSVRGLRTEEGPEGPVFIYTNGDMTIYACVLRDLVLVASSQERLDKVRVRNPGTRAFDLNRALDEAARFANTRAAGTHTASLDGDSVKEDTNWQKEAVRVLAAADSSALFQLLSLEGLPGQLGQTLGFAKPAGVSLELANEGIALRAEVPVQSSDQLLSVILARRSSTPAVLSRLPASTRWYSLLSMASAAELWAAIEPHSGKAILDAWQLAQQGTKLALGLSVEDLLFSWMGPEYGVFGGEHDPMPVFFVSVADEKQRKRVFNTLFSNILLDRDLSVVVGETRVPRIGLPPVINRFMANLGIDLPSPFYLVHDGILYASMSAEALERTVRELQNHELLVRSEHWKSTGERAQAESSASLFYSLDRSIPFFLRGNSVLQKVLKLYGQGLASLSTDGEALQFTLNAVPGSGPARESGPIPGYPITSPFRLSGDILVASDEQGDDWGFCAGTDRILSVHLPSGRTREHRLDGRASLALERSPEGSFVALWAVSDRGSIYRLDKELKNTGNFPLLSGEQPGAVPLAQKGRLYLPIVNGPAILIVDADGTLSYSDKLHERQRAKPTALEEGFAIAPRSFDSLLYLMDGDGRIVPGYPRELDGILAGAPAAWTDPQGIRYIACVSEAGICQIFKRDDPAEDPIQFTLPQTLASGPLWSSATASLMYLGSDGALYRIASDGTVLAWSPSGKSGRDLSLSMGRIWQTNTEALFLAGDGDQVHAFNSELLPLPGFPIPGASNPAFPDINRDGQKEILTRGLDDRIHLIRSDGR